MCMGNCATYDVYTPLFSSEERECEWKWKWKVDEISKNFSTYIYIFHVNSSYRQTPKEKERERVKGVNLLVSECGTQDFVISVSFFCAKPARQTATDDCGCLVIVQH